MQKVITRNNLILISSEIKKAASRIGGFYHAYFFLAIAFTNSTNKGCGLNGLDLNSGWN